MNKTINFILPACISLKYHSASWLLHWAITASLVIFTIMLHRQISL